VLLIREQHEFDYIKLFSNMLDIVPVESDEEQQIVLKAVNYFEEGMTAFGSFHAATAETRGYPILGSDKAYDGVGSERLLLEPTDDEWCLRGYPSGETTPKQHRNPIGSKGQSGPQTGAVDRTLR